MRVQESQPGVSQTMTKKKHKLRKQAKENEMFPSDSSDEASAAASGPRCSHLAKAVNFNSMKKALKQQAVIGECASCAKEGNGAKALETAEEDTGAELLDQVETTVWICLQCGHQGCDRNSREQHSLKHYETPRSASHCLVLNAQTWSIWCYDCDSEVSLSSSRHLEECIEFIRKQMGLSRSDSQSRGGKGGAESAVEPAAPSLTDQANLQNKAKVVSNVTTALTLPKVKGLRNLGNTCFFNAVMQNLCQTHILELALNEYGLKGYMLHLGGRDIEEDIESLSSSSASDEDNDKELMEPLNVLLQESGSLTQSLMAFLRDMNCVTKNSTVSPNSLFGEICRKAPRFKDYQQQDSHELLRQLLDGIKAEEIRRSQQSILRAFKLSEKINPKKVDDKTKTKIKGYGKQIKHTFVDKVFGGYFISTVLCEECKMPSQIFEPFLDISLPIAEEKPVRLNNLGGGKRAGNVSPTEPVADLAQRSLESFTEASGPSKHQLKKAKKQARREAKRGRRGRTVSQSQQDAAASDAGDKQDATKLQRQVSKEEDTNSNEEWDSKSDADVEDNVESDVSRTKSQSVSNMDAVGRENETSHNLDDIEFIDQQPGELMNGHCSSVEQLSAGVKAIKLDEDDKGKAHVNGEVKSKSLQLLDVKLRAMSPLVPRQQTEGHGCSLTSCLNQFTSSELLTGSNKFGCHKCTYMKYGRQSQREKKEVVYTNASKQVLIFCPPAVLTLHLKRFQQVGFSLRKVNRHVDFPLVLDLAPYCSAVAQGVEAGRSQVLYSLYGVVEHSGRLSGGHYTAYVKVRPNCTRHKQFLQHLDLTGLKVSAALWRLMEQEESLWNPRNPTPPGEEQQPPTTGKWYYISDSRVNEVNESNVLRCQAYLLFYERTY